MGWCLGLAPATLEFWVRFPNEKPAPPWVGSRSPDGWDQIPRWAGGWACTRHPGVLGSIPKREEPGKTGAPCVKVPGSSRVPAPPWVGSRSPDGWDQIPRWVGGWVLHQAPWSFGFDSQTRNQPRPGWAPDPLMVGIRSPDGLVVGLAPGTLEFWVRFPNERNQGKQAHPVLKYRVPHVSQPRPGWAPDPLMVGIRSPDGLVVGSCTRHPGVLGSIPKREEPGKTGAPCVKVPGSSRVPVRDEQTHPHRPRLVVSHSTCPPLSSSPHANSFVIGPVVIKHTPGLHSQNKGINAP
jgi:hypothetical protein